MRRLDEALSDLVEGRRADGPDHLIDALRRRLAGEAEVVALPMRTDIDTTRTRSRWRGPLIATAALAAALLIALPILWLGAGDETNSTDRAPAVAATTEPSTTVAPSTTLTPATTVTPMITVTPATTVLPSHLEPAPLQLGDEIEFSQSGETLWAWDEDGRVASYRDGVWQTHRPLPGLGDIAGTRDGAVWAVTTGNTENLWYLEEGDWRVLPSAVTFLGPETDLVEVDSATGAVWVLSGGRLSRWDGVGMSHYSQAGSSPERTLDDIFIAGDGTIWGARANPYHPEDDGLVRFDEDTGWVSVRPLGGTEDLPASIAITPGGNLWVRLPDPAAPQLDPTGFVGVYLDTVTGEWTTYRLPDGSGGVVADKGVVWADGEVVWWQQSDLFRFDGHTIAVFAPGGGMLDNLGLGNDGTVWVTIRYERNGVYRLVIDEKPTK